MKLLIFDHTGKEKDIQKAMKVVNSYSPLPLFWKIVELKGQNAVFVDPPVNGNYHIDPDWFKNAYTVNAQGYDFCIAYFSPKQWAKNRKKNKSKAESINQNFGVSEIALSGSTKTTEPRGLAPKIKESQFVTRLLHEMCHGMFDHKLHVEDVTHYWHYEKKNLLEALKLWVVNNREKLYQTALGCLGTDASPNDVAPDELGCAETVNDIHTKAFGEPIGGTVSTYKLYQALKTNPLFIKVDQPLRGDVIISPTGYGTGGLPNGHTGIVGDGVIMSNDSATGLFKANYTMDSWRKRYVEKGGYPMFFFRRV